MNVVLIKAKLTLQLSTRHLKGAQIKPYFNLFGENY